MTTHDPERGVAGVVELETDLKVWFVQPLPEGRVLLMAARSRGEIWTSGGDLERRGGLGDALEEVLTTPAGSIWVGYFDEAMGGHGPAGHGLARFNDDLSVGWVYRSTRGPAPSLRAARLHPERRLAPDRPAGPDHAGVWA